MAASCVPVPPVHLDPGYWQELEKRKLEEYQLREDPVTIRGSYSNYRNISTPFLSLDYTAFDVGYQPTGLDLPSPGLLRNMNTIASFLIPVVLSFWRVLKMVIASKTRHS